jgi:mannose-6-phosphate isomerase-like protein (cupin superfamily)
MRGEPGALRASETVEVRIPTEKEAEGQHAVYFNRGVAGSQAYVRKFDDRRPSDVPDRAAFRQKFLNEHTHSEDEVRFFVAGAGQFTLHIGEKVYEVLCEKGDLIGVPDGTRHWFDMSESPYFVAIRLFTNKEGWVANFTGEDIAEQFPRMKPHASARAA